MAEKISKLQRWLDLVAYLAGRRVPATVEEVWGAVPAYSRGLGEDDREHETVRRMFERDKDELRAAGIPIETVTFSLNYGAEESHGYRLARRDFHLPYLRLVQEAEEDERRVTRGEEPSSFPIEEHEAAAALDGLRKVAALPGFPLEREAHSAFRKLAFDLDPGVFELSPVLYVEDPETAAATDTLHRLFSALLARKTITCRYHSMGRDAESVRTVRPYGLVFQHGRWYLVGLAEDRDAVRMFRVGRMNDVTPNTRSPGTPDFEIPADFELRAYSGRKAWEMGEPPEPAVQARIRFRFPRSLWAERNDYGTLIREEEDGSHLREFAVRRPEPFLRWVLSLEGDAVVEDPPELSAAYRDLVAAVAGVYGPRKGDVGEERPRGRR